MNPICVFNCTSCGCAIALLEPIRDPRVGVWCPNGHPNARPVVAKVFDVMVQSMRIITQDDPPNWRRAGWVSIEDTTVSNFGERNT